MKEKAKVTSIYGKMGDNMAPVISMLDVVRAANNKCGNKTICSLCEYNHFCESLRECYKEVQRICDTDKTIKDFITHAMMTVKREDNLKRRFNPRQKVKVDLIMVNSHCDNCKYYRNYHGYGQCYAQKGAPRIDYIHCCAKFKAKEWRNNNG